MKIVILLLILLNVLNVADFILTDIALSSGKVVEANPFYRPTPTYLASKIFVVLIFSVVWWTALKVATKNGYCWAVKILNAILCLLVAVFVGIVLNNLFWVIIIHIF